MRRGPLSRPVPSARWFRRRWAPLPSTPHRSFLLGRPVPWDLSALVPSTRPPSSPWARQCRCPSVRSARSPSTRRRLILPIPSARSVPSARSRRHCRWALSVLRRVPSGLSIQFRLFRPHRWDPLPRRARDARDARDARALPVRHTPHTRHTCHTCDARSSPHRRRRILTHGS